MMEVNADYTGWGLLTADGTLYKSATGLPMLWSSRPSAEEYASSTMKPVAVTARVFGFTTMSECQQFVAESKDE